MDKEPITVSGLEELKKELNYLKNIKRQEIISAIAEARSHGDLKENAEYHAAKEEQSHSEGRIQDSIELQGPYGIVFTSLIFFMLLGFVRMFIGADYDTEDT